LGGGAGGYSEFGICEKFARVGESSPCGMLGETVGGV